ncbi:IS481 family transposase [Burkholderia multivorans]|uniref:IS481 family transposase n=1 Tax=Burkholderia multivorans TaxID=87883 RepID=UPI0025AD9881|nr:IS481 family transposase [Burkholderia multivorans]
MHLRLHKNATTTPRIRAEIQVSKEPMRVLAQRFGVSVCTIARWKKRASVHDASHTPHRLQTTLTPAQESIVLVLRKSLGLSLDDLLAVVREFIHPTISRAALHRMLKRHGVSAREALSVDRPRTKPFKAYEPGFVHIDVKYLPQMADETTRRYLFVAIDRATRWVFVRVYASKSATNARRFLKELHKAAAFRIRTILTDNGKEFTDRFITRGERTPTGRHQFDQLCEELGIEHRLTRPKHPQTNGMVERFNGRIADILRTHHFHCGEELEATILRYVWLYNHQLPQKALGHVSPIQAMKQWQRSHPELFNRRVTNQPGHDTLALYRDGKASVMFLDLTMPDMNGYQVLETLRHEDMNTFVIVVSADIQPQAQARVRELGAIAFVAKPVTSEALLPILKEYGLYA